MLSLWLPALWSTVALLFAAPAALAGDFTLHALEDAEAVISLGAFVTRSTPIRGTMTGNDDDAFIVDDLDMTADSFSMTVLTLPIEVYDIAVTLPQAVIELIGRENQAGTEIVFDSTQCDCDDFAALLHFVADIDGDIVTPEDLGGGTFQGPLVFNVSEEPQAFSSSALAPGQTLQTSLNFAYKVDIGFSVPVDLTVDVFLHLPEPGSTPLQAAALVALVALARRRKSAAGLG